MNEVFRKLSKTFSQWMGRPLAFVLALTLILGWILVGPIFHFSDTWQLVINTGTTIITFLMVFVIQNTQNRESLSMQLKLDELIRATTKARNNLIDLEEFSDFELTKLHKEFCALKEHYEDRAAHIAKQRKSKG